MRILLLTDTKITRRDRETVTKEFTELVEKHTGITPEYFIEETDYSNYPVYLDSDGDARPDKQYLKNIHNNASNRYGDHGIDYVVNFIHEDNWMSSGNNFDNYRKSKGLKPKRGIWGTAWAYKYRSFLTNYNRWDKNNLANNIGTMYHEGMHPIDALISVELGININPIIEAMLRIRYKNEPEVIQYLDRNGFNWDRDFVHGGINPPYKYIRFKENTEVLAWASPYIVRAFEQRREKHKEYTELQKTAITVLKDLVYWLKKKLNMKDGVSLN